MNYEFEKSLGQNIRLLREERNMTQKELASKLQVENCDITRSALAKMEVGARHIYPDEIAAIKKIFKIEYDDLFPKNLS